MTKPSSCCRIWSRRGSGYLNSSVCHLVSHSSTHHFIIYNLYHFINFFQTNPHYTYSQWASGVSLIIIHNTR
jgi:hypothetical protein